MGIFSIQKTLLVFSSIVCSTNVFAGYNDKNKDRCCKTEVEGCYSVELANGKTGCFLQSDRPSDDLCYGFELGASAIYWKPYVDGTEYAYTSTGTSGTLPINGSLVIPKTSMSWGFQVFAGYLSSQDGWEADAQFTFHKGKGNNTFSISNGNAGEYIVPVTAVTSMGILDGDNVTSFTNGNSSLHSHFYRLSLTLSRGAYISRLFTINPGMGLTTTWLKIDQNSTFSSELYSNFYEDQDNKSWQIGPTLSFDTAIHFGDSGFSLVADSDITLGFGTSQVSQHSYYAVNPSTNSSYISDNNIIFEPNAHIFLGFQYERGFCEATQYLKLMAGLDTFVMWDGYRIIKAYNNQNLVVSEVGNSQLQFEQQDGNQFSLVGLTVSLNYLF